MSFLKLPFPVEARFTLRDSLETPDPETMAVAVQVHGTNVRWVETTGLYPDTDGLITRTPGLTLGIKVADCAAILFSDPANGIVAAIHAGWRGAVGGIHHNAIEKMVEAGTNPQDIVAWISPCIGIRAFEVGEEVAVRFSERFVHRDGFEKPHVDLGGFLESDLISAGLNPANLTRDGRCTVEHPDVFWSYRRENESAGRMMAMITNQTPILRP
jgi:YfiH family protein